MSRVISSPTCLTVSSQRPRSTWVCRWSPATHRSGRRTSRRSGRWSYSAFAQVPAGIRLCELLADPPAWPWLDPLALALRALHVMSDLVDQQVLPFSLAPEEVAHDVVTAFVDQDVLQSVPPQILRCPYTPAPVAPLFDAHPKLEFHRLVALEITSSRSAGVSVAKTLFI